MSDSSDSIDWVRVIIHGLVGLLFGAAVGFTAWALWLESLNFLLVVALPAVVVAAVAAWKGDAFWASLPESSWWRPW